MGNASWSQSDWNHHSSQTSQKTREQIFKRNSIDPNFDPKNIKRRESVDSVANPLSTPIIVSCDVTGSMGELAEIIIRKGMNTIMQEIYDRKPVTDPHLCIMATGDAFTDQAPLQVTQFEASIVLAKQLENIYLEGKGGGNGGESYTLAWWFATFRCISDAYQKRNKKGYLFTIGDESPHDTITVDQVRKFLGVGCERDIPAKELLDIAKQYWNIYHLMVRPVPTQEVEKDWRDLLGNNAVLIEDHNHLAEAIVAIIQKNEGQDLNSVLAGWDDSAKSTVENAVRYLLPAN